jgi:hypothetical protein
MAINHTATLIGGLLFIGGLIAVIVVTTVGQNSWTTEPESNAVDGDSNYQGWAAINDTILFVD